VRSSCDSTEANLFTPMLRLDDDRDGTSSGDGMAFIT